MTDVVVTRVSRSGRSTRSRTLDERAWARFPAVYRHLARVFPRLSPRSRLRRALLKRMVVSGWASFDRRDFKLNRVHFAADVEFEFPIGMQTLGLEGPFRGQDGRIGGLEKLVEVFGFELKPAYVLDMGGRVLILGGSHARASASGVVLEQELAQVVTLRDGLVIRDQMFLSWQDAIRATGLDPDAILSKLQRPVTPRTTQLHA